MLVLRRKEGQWVEITHKSGDVIRVKVYNIRTQFPGQIDVAFDDNAHNFQIQRPERYAEIPVSTEGATEAMVVEVMAN